MPELSDDEYHDFKEFQRVQAELLELAQHSPGILDFAKDREAMMRVGKKASKFTIYLATTIGAVITLIAYLKGYKLPWLD